MRTRRFVISLVAVLVIIQACILIWLILPDINTGVYSPERYLGSWLAFIGTWIGVPVLLLIFLGVWFGLTGLIYLIWEMVRRRRRRGKQRLQDGCLEARDGGTKDE
jgi:type VI protein secretion system component VasK